jgi:hypothetical protein
MTQLRLVALLAPLAAALALADHATVRKDALGVYGVIDSVVFEPSAQ